MTNAKQLLGWMIVALAVPVMWAQGKTAFPKWDGKQPWSVKLERGGCDAPCAVYTVTLAANGAVEYEGKVGVAVPGKHTAQGKGQQFRQVLDLLRQADFLKLATAGQPGSPAAGRDAAAVPAAADRTAVTLRWGAGGRTESTVEAGAGTGQVAESKLISIEDAIDRIAGTEKWVKGNAETIPALRAEGWDFKADDAQHAALLNAVCARGNVEVAQGLLAAGAAVNAKDAKGDTALFAAISDRRLEVIQLLLDSGASTRVKNADGETPLEMSKELAYDDITALLVKAGAK